MIAAETENEQNGDIYYNVYLRLSVIMNIYGGKERKYMDRLAD